jgi:antitoxin PrlF
MERTIFIENAKVMSKGQVTIPKDVRKILGVGDGDHIYFIVDGNDIRIMNSAVYAMRMLQAEMVGEAGRTGLTKEEDIMALVKEQRQKGSDS